MITSTGPEGEKTLNVQTHRQTSLDHEEASIQSVLQHFNFTSRATEQTGCWLTSVGAGSQQVDDVLVVTQVAQDLQLRHQSLPLV